jgi:hypothetical protein
MSEESDVGVGTPGRARTYCRLFFFGGRKSREGATSPPLRANIVLSFIMTGYPQGTGREQKLEK